MYSYYINKSETNPFQNMEGDDWIRYTPNTTNANETKYFPNINSRTDGEAWWNYSGGIRHIDTTITGNYFCFNYGDNYALGGSYKRYSYVYMFKLLENVGGTSFPYIAVYNSSNDNNAPIYEDIVGFAGLSIVEYKESVLLTFSYGSQGAGNSSSHFNYGNDNTDIVAGILIFDKDTNDALTFSSKTTYEKTQISQFMFPFATCKYIVGFRISYGNTGNNYTIIFLDTIEGSSSGSSSGSSTTLQLLYNTNYLTNDDTSYNLTLPSSVSNILSIANNRENYVISCVDSSNNILYYSNDLIKWNKVEDITNILGATCKNVEYDGTQFIASGSKGVAYSNDGIEWFNGNDISNILVNSVISNNVYENQIKQSRNLIIVAGDVSNNEASLAYSHEGFYWLSISGSADIFNYRANAVKCNGDKWVAVGVSNNTIAFSEDGYKWHGLGKYYLNVEGICIESGYDENDNKLWVAGGEGTYNLVYSYDGISWKDASFNNDIDMTKINSIKYDGSIWCAGGESDTSLSLLYSVNGKEWNKSTTLQNQMEMRIVKSIESDGYMWIAVGSKTKVENSDYIHAYSSDGKDWWFLEENINDLCDNKITKIKYVNNSWIVTTSNTTDVSGLYYSFDGFNWLKGRNLSLNSGLTDIEYCGDIYVETCSNITSNSSILIDTTFEPYANVSENRNSIYPTYMVTDISAIGKDKTQKTENGRFRYVRRIR